MRPAAESEIDTTVLLNLLAICKEHRGSYNENNIQVLVSHATPELEKLPKGFDFSHFYHAQNIIPVWNNESLHYPVFLVTARWLQNQKRYQESITLFDTMLKSNSEETYVKNLVTFNKARCIEDSGAYVAALQLYGTIKSKSLHISVTIGRCYENIAEMHNKDLNAQYEFYDLAIHEYESALPRSFGLVPMQQRLLLCIGRCYEKMDKNALSIEYFKKAERLQDNNPTVKSTLFFAVHNKKQMHKEQKEEELEFIP